MIIQYKQSPILLPSRGAGERLGALVILTEDLSWVPSTLTPAQEHLMPFSGSLGTVPLPPLSQVHHLAQNMQVIIAYAFMILL